jgi:hypothetical protein
MLSRRGHHHCLRRLSGEGSQPFENEAAGSEEHQQGDSISRSSRTHISGTHTRSDPVHVPAGRSSPLLASASCISRTAVRCLPAASGGSADQAEWLALADVRDHAHPASTTAPPTPASPATRWTIFACAHLGACSVTVRRARRHTAAPCFEFELNLPDSGGGYAVHFSQILFRFASRNDRSNYLATETVTWISDVPVIRTIVPVT